MPRIRSSATSSSLTSERSSRRSPGPKRPQDRIALAVREDRVPRGARGFRPRGCEEARQPPRPRRSPIRSRPPTRPATITRRRRDAAPGDVRSDGDRRGRSPPRTPSSVTLDDGTKFELDHGMVVIAAITSCTNTSNPSVMVGAGLLAKKAVERGLDSQPWVKTSLAPGSMVVTEYLEQAGLDEYLDKLGFNLVGYGCTTCIGNSGPAARRRSPRRSRRKDLMVCSVLSGNRNFEGRINQDVRNNYLASPPLVVAYALAGRMDVDLTTEPLGEDSDGEPVHLADLWPSSEEIKSTVADAVRSEMFQRSYADVFTGDERWQAIEVPEGDRYTWPDSTYVRKPPFFEGMDAEPARDRADRRRPRAGGARRQRHHRPHLAGGRHQARQPGRQVADGAGRRSSRLQLVRLTPRQPRGDDARDVRERPASQRAGRPRGRLHQALPLRRRRWRSTTRRCATRTTACRLSSSPARSTARAAHATGRPRARRCSACAR